MEIVATYYIKGDFIKPTGKEKWSEKIEAPIGIMYISDYYYAYKTNDNDAGNPGSYNNADNSWIYISHNQSVNQSINNNEWTMCRSGFTPQPIGNGFYKAWHVPTYGSKSLNTANAVCPVFYLTSGVELTGEGSISNPFKIF